MKVAFIEDTHVYKDTSRYKEPPELGRIMKGKTKMIIHIESKVKRKKGEHPDQS